ncbi:MAG: MAE_28990/MAE_18760 family HEPN-like nuclease [Bacteroidales bacterium]
MNEIRNQFHRELQDLRKLITFFNSEIKLLADFDLSENNINNEILGELSTNLKIFHISKRQFNYNSIIISLYGSFERFIENILISYIDIMNRLIDKYDRLPEAIIKNHFTLSLSLLNKIEQPKYTGPLKKEEIISNLHTCININEGYQINKDAFSQHTANFRLQVIDESFAHIGIQAISSQIKKHEWFYKYIILKTEKNEGDVISLEESFHLLNDLAERRNDVAHGVASEILQNEILLEYIEFFEVYLEALSQVLNQEYLHIELKNTGKKLGNITDVFHDGKVICIFSNNISIKIGDFLIGYNESKIVKAKIANLKLDGANIEFVDDQNNYELGIEIDQIFRTNFNVFLV